MNQPATKACVQSAVDSAINGMRRMQLGDGSWSWTCQVGPASTALCHLVLDKLGAAPEGDTPKVIAWLKHQQLPDGGFVLNPFEEHASLTSTAACWAALSRYAPDDPATARAHETVDKLGGLQVVADSITLSAAFHNTTDPYLTAAVLAFVGMLDPAILPQLPLSYAAIPGSQDVLKKLINLGLMFGEQQAASLISAVKKEPDGAIHNLAIERMRELSLSFRNDNGSWNNTVSQTLVSIAALVATGEPADSSLVKGSAAWVLKNRTECTQTGHVWYHEFNGAVWSTAMVLRAMLESGVPPTDKTVKRGIHWMWQSQLGTRQPNELNVEPGSHVASRGGFAFEESNKLLPDCDDTGYATSLMGMVLQYEGTGDVDTQTMNHLSDAAEKNVDWLQRMQNDDGGWGSYSHNLPGKPKGNFAIRAPISLLHPLRSIKTAQKFLASLGDPSTSGLTGRVLLGLGRNGFDKNAPAVQKARDFLFANQLEDGSWWGRWMTNYLAGTSWVLMGLAEVGASKDEPPIQKAIEYLLSHQNDDGGWGETHETYQDKSLSGTGPSMPGLTGNVLTALLSYGMVKHEAVQRGVAYLLRTQCSDGSWHNKGWLHVYLLPKYFYTLPVETLVFPLEALGRYLAIGDGEDLWASGESPAALQHAEAYVAGEQSAALPPSPRDANGGWSAEGLRRWRSQGDPEADEVIATLIAEGGPAQANSLFKLLVANDDPVPEAMPEVLSAWFAEGSTTSRSALPPWADAGKIARAQDVYVRHGWALAMLLLCSSLPQAYAASNGARVIAKTQGLSEHTRRRILETAQFLFDVLDPDGFGPDGRAIRSCQKIRLMHATIRVLMLRQGSWDSEAWGVPINMEDMAGTLMTFSGVILDGFHKLGLPISDEDADAFMHLWRCVGYLLGLPEPLLPNGYADARALMDAIRTDQWQQSVHGFRLAAYLASAMAEYLPVPHGKMLAFELIRTFAGSHCAELLHLPHATWASHLVRSSVAVLSGLEAGATPDDGTTPSLLQRLSRHLMEGLVAVQREGKGVYFRLPPALIRKWQD